MLLLTSAFVYPVEKEAIPQEKPELSHYEKAVDFYKNRDLWLGSISEAKMHLQEHPYHLPSYNLIARVYLEFNEFPKAAEAILTALGKGLSKWKRESSMATVWKYSRCLGITVSI